MLSVSLSIPRPITCYHSMTKNLTLLCSASVFQCQGPLHVTIVWQKTSLHCTQFQFFNPKSCYMYPMAYKLLNSLQPSVTICTLFYLFYLFSHDHVLLSHTYLSSDSSISWPCTFISCLSFLWFISLTTVYFYLTLWLTNSYLRNVYKTSYSLYIL